MSRFKLMTPAHLLLFFAFVMSLTFAVWQVLLNNFSIDLANFTGREIGILQSIREIPGFLAFTAIYLLLFVREQTFAFFFLALMCFGIAITGWFPTAMGLYCTTLVMSIGFHYFETVNQSLTLQWIDKENTPQFMGKALAYKSAASLIAFALVWLVMDYFTMSYNFAYISFGVFGLVAVLLMWLACPRFEQAHVQEKKLILRRRYWLYYALTFFSGARRQIFIVFAGFMMVEKFGYSVGQISLLFMINYLFNMLCAPAIGRWIAKVGEKHTLTIEYAGLIIIFSSYALVENATWAAVLYVADHLFFALAIAIKTYFQKIADPKDMASTAGVSFTINHIAAVVIPVILGLLWLYSSALVFFIGAGFALCSLLLSRLIPDTPEPGYEVRWPIQRAHVEDAK
ncbi:hypothetical protein VST7929_01792 [Vibrio stylophorae]|uniref:MFS transporter n=1 Tax=Vibrio stylophorae TaxID=659351 RepID=A0ABM8ZUQ2_9VIBR|nr:MFS transporter [Vibrio stylophorae]CAH0533915.1 hypothetical protein VST7929_01792 [Vibrio stylophorae]